MAKNKRKKNAPRRTSGDPRRAAEQRREAHARLVRERDGDKTYAQSTHTQEGRRYSWVPDSDPGVQMAEMVRRGRAQFVEKFGREPGPEDPLFFDPEASEPRSMEEADFDWDVVFEAFDATGIDPAYAEAWRELGYLVTEMNRHTFTAHEVEAWDEAVERYVGEEE